MRISCSVCGIVSANRDAVQCSTAMLSRPAPRNRERTRCSVILFRMSVTAPVARDAGPPGAGAGVDAPRALALARDVLATEASAIAGLASRLGEPFVAA